MNIDLLKKFVRLATNNPNEHEANSAARRVCKMLLEDDFKCLMSQPVVQPLRPMYPEPANSNDVKRSSPASDPTWWKTDPFKGFDFGFYGKNPFDREDNPFRHKPPPEYKPKEPRQPREKQKLKCKTCGEEILTGFVGPPQMFECNKCIWDFHNKTHP